MENPSKICPHRYIFITRNKERQRELRKTSCSKRDRETRERVLLKLQMIEEVFPSIKNGSRHLNALREKRNVEGKRNLQRDLAYRCPRYQHRRHSTGPILQVPQVSAQTSYDGTYPTGAPGISTDVIRRDLSYRCPRSQHRQMKYRPSTMRTSQESVHKWPSVNDDTLAGILPLLHFLEIYKHQCR